MQFVNSELKTCVTPPQESDGKMNNNKQGQGGRNDKLVISAASKETGLGTAGMEQCRSLANQKPSLNNSVTKFVTVSDNLC